MPYTGSKAQVGRGTVLSIGGTPTEVGECKSLKLNGRQIPTEDISNLDSTAHEFIGTLPESGEWDVAGNRIGNDAGQVAMETAFAAGTTTAFTIQLPKTAAQVTTGDKWAFNAVITELNYGIDITKAIDFAAKLKVSGPLTLTPGS